MPVSVITDSAASLGPDLAKQLGVVTVPMQLEIAGEPVDESQMSLDELVARLDGGIRTSSPSPGAFLEAIELVDSADGVVVLTVSQHLSSTFQAARSAASMSAYPERVRVIDTGTAAGAQGLVVIAAARQAVSGSSLDDVSERAQVAARNVRLVAAVSQLKYLVRGGRLPAMAAKAGEHLGVRPVFEMSQAHIRPMRPSLSADGAIDQILGAWRRSRVEHADLHIAALHALSPQDAETLLQKVRAEQEPATSFIGNFGPVMVAHTGPGVIGLAWWWEQPGCSSLPTPPHRLWQPARLDRARGPFRVPDRGGTERLPRHADA